MTGPLEFVDLQAQRRRLGDRIDKAIAKVLQHGQFVMGPEVHELEERLAEYTGARHAISCASGTDALVLALLGQGIGPGDVVLVPSFTFAATAEAVALLGAIPMFVEVEADSFNLSPSSLVAAVASAAESGLKPVGVIAVDLFGRPAEYKAIERITQEAGLWLIADAAQSFGAAYGGRRVGSVVSTTTTSFFPAKPLGCYGDGGAIFTDDDSLAVVLRSLRVHGQGADKYDNVRIGINGRLDTMQAAILLEKLNVFDAELESRTEAARTYDRLLGAVVRTPKAGPLGTSAWAQYTVVLPPHIDRQKMIDHLAEIGVPSAVYYRRPVHLQGAYRRYPVAPDGLPVTEELARRVLSLPMHPYLTEADQSRVSDAVLASAA